MDWPGTAVAVCRLALTGILLACFPFGFAWPDVGPGYIDAQIQLLEVDGKPVIIYNAWGNNSQGGNREIIFGEANFNSPHVPDDWRFSSVDDDFGFNWSCWSPPLVDAKIINGKPALAFSPIGMLNSQNSTEAWRFVRLNLALGEKLESPIDWLGLNTGLDRSADCVAIAELDGKVIIAASDSHGQTSIASIHPSASGMEAETDLVQNLEPFGIRCNWFDMLGIGDTLLIASAGDMEGRCDTANMWVLPQGDPAKATSIELGLSWPFQPCLAKTSSTVGVLWMNRDGLQFAWCDYSKSGGFSEWYTVRVVSGITWEYGLCFIGEQPGITYRNKKGIFYVQPKTGLDEQVEWQRTRIRKDGGFDLQLEVINGEPYIAYMTNDIADDPNKTGGELRNGALYLAYPEPGQAGFPKKWITTTVIEPQYKAGIPVGLYLFLFLAGLVVLVLATFLVFRQKKELAL